MLVRRTKLKKGTDRKEKKRKNKVRKILYQGKREKEMEKERYRESNREIQKKKLALLEIV